MSKSKMKWFVLIIIILFISYKLISFISTFHLYAAGTYPYVETYNFPYSEKKVINALASLNLKNANLKDKDTTDYWHDIYFDLEGRRIQAWTRPFDENNTVFALVAIYNYNDRQWQLVNQDLGLFKNIMIKRAFEKDIIDRLEIELKK